LIQLILAEQLYFRHARVAGRHQLCHYVARRTVRVHYEGVPEFKITLQYDLLRGLPMDRNSLDCLTQERQQKWYSPTLPSWDP
jgi:hypothetical protein